MRCVKDGECWVHESSEEREMGFCIYFSLHAIYFRMASYKTLHHHPPFHPCSLMLSPNDVHERNLRVEMVLCAGKWCCLNVYGALYVRESSSGGT